jgi:hypothetical protein
MEAQPHKHEAAMWLTAATVTRENMNNTQRDYTMAAAGTTKTPGLVTEPG